MIRTRRAKIPTAPTRESRLIWRCAAVLLDYPNTETFAALPDLRSVAATLPAPGGPALEHTAAWLCSTDPMRAAAEYVAVFDLRRRHSLHLTYYAHGDTRGRGMALLRFKHAYRSSGTNLNSESELPDFLPLVLEFAARADPEQGARLLGEHVPVLELLRLSLCEKDNPYAPVLEAVLSTLPPVTTADRRRIEQLAAEGPPVDQVGLDGLPEAAMAPYTLTAPSDLALTPGKRR